MTSEQLKMLEVEQQVNRRIQELQVLKQKILDTPRGSMSSNFFTTAPEFKKQYLEIANYMKEYDWNHA